MSTPATRFSTWPLLLGLTLPGSALALGLGDIRSDTRLGEPLLAEITLLRDPGERVDAHCFRLVKPNGDLPWVRQASLSLAAPDRLVIKGSRPQTEPIVQLAVAVACGHELRREYTLMPLPPAEGTQAIASAGQQAGAASIKPVETAGRRPRSPATAAENTGLPPSRRAERRRTVSEAAPLRRAEGLMPQPERPAAALPRPAGDRLVLSGGAEEGVAPPLRLSQELGVIPNEAADAADANLALQRRIFRLEYRMLAWLENQTLAASTPEMPPASPQERLKALETALGGDLPQAATTDKPATTAPAPAGKPASPPPAAATESEGGWTALVWGGAGVLFAAALAALGWRIWQRRRQARDAAHAADEAVSLAALIEPKSTAHDPFDDFDAPVHSTGGKKPAASGTLSAFSTFSVPPASRQPNVLDETPAAIVPPVRARDIEPESVLDASVDEVFSHNPVVELADIMLSFGRVKGAAQALQEYIEQNPKEALQPWVKLLEVYRLAGMKEEFEKLAKSLNQNFNVELVRWEDVPKPGEPASVDFVLELEPMDGKQQGRPQSIEDMPHIKARIVETWGTPACLEYIQSLLRDNRAGARQGFPLPVAEDLVFLSELLQDEMFQGASGSAGAAGPASDTQTGNDLGVPHL